MNNTTSNITLNQVTFDNIGEHGIYTHSSNGYLKFEECIFHNCGQSPKINQLRKGFSACVRPSVSLVDSMSERDLKLFFSRCTFSNEGDISVLTSYGGASFCEFDHCVWEGKVLGYSETTGLPEALANCIEYVFMDCKNPPSRYSGYNTVRRLFRCSDVYNLFEDTVEAVDCKCILAYSDVRNRYSAFFASGLETPIVIRNCSFTSEESKLPPRVVIHNPRPMCFLNCVFALDEADLGGYHGYAISFVDDDNSESAAGCGDVLISDCTFDMGLMRFMRTVDTTIEIHNCLIKNYYDAFINGPSNSNRVLLDNVETKEISSVVKNI